MATPMNIGRWRVVCSTSLLSGSVLFQSRKDVSAATRKLDEHGFNKDAEVFHVHVACGRITAVERISSRGKSKDVADPRERKAVSERGQRLGREWEGRMRRRAGL